MRAIVAHRYGPPDVLQLEDRAVPEPGPGEVLVRVRAASVGAWDVHDMRGEPYFMRLAGLGLRRPRTPVLGRDMAGEVIDTGAGVTSVRPGDRVYGECGATWADYTVAKEFDLALAPPSLSFEEAAAVPIAGATALLGLRDHARARAGDTVLVIGAAGGVGTFAVQIARAFDAHVTAVCAPRSEGLVRSLGASAVIDYSTTDITRLDERYDVVFQLAGTASGWALRRVLRPGGRLVPSSGEGGGRVLGPLVRMAATLAISPLLRHSTRMYVAKADSDNLDVLAGMIERGEIKPVIDATLPLELAADAVRRFETGHGPGKIVLSM